MEESICQIGIDSDKRVYAFYEGERYFLGQIKFNSGGVCFFHPETNCFFLKEALVAIAEIMSKVCEMPSDEEIDELFNDKQ